MSGPRGTTIRAVGVGAMVLAAAVAAAPGGQAEEADVGALLAEAERSYDRWSGPFDLAGYEASLRRAIALWEEALPLVDEADAATRVRVLTHLSQAYYELAFAYLETSRDRESTYEEGKDAALAALQLDPAFVAARQRDGFRAALRAATDVASIFWYGNNLGQWLDYHHFTALRGGVRDLEASYARAIELDETYAAGGPHRSMGAFLAQAYFALRRSRDESVVHFERSIELDPTYLENQVNYAEYYARAIGDDALFDTLLSMVFDAADDPSTLTVHPFYNALAIARAEALRSGG